MIPADVDPPLYLPTGRHNSRRVQILRNLSADADVASWLADPVACQQVAKLIELAERFCEEGADLRPYAALIATHLMVRRWLDISDAMTERSAIATTDELARKRRKGVLRQLGGAEVGLPVSGPPILIVPPDQEPFYGILEDELEYHPLRVYRKTLMRPYRVPVKPVLNSKDARALLGWKWYHFERYFRSHTQDPTGRRLVRGSREYAFDAMEFARYIYENSL